MFNILSFLGICHEGLLIYVGVMIIIALDTTSITLNTTSFLFFTVIDAMCVAFLCILLSIAISHKDQYFFAE